MKKPILVIMAAGMGSRYGGLKQIDPVDEQGDIIVDFSVYDAVRAGFGKVIFIIKEENDAVFRQTVASHFKDAVEVEYAYQRLEDIPSGFKIPEGRVKPWGTAHAVLSCADMIDAPFAVINADDFYGREAFVRIHDFLVGLEENGGAFGSVSESPSADNAAADSGVFGDGAAAKSDAGNGTLRSVPESTAADDAVSTYAMVGFRLANTLTDNGYVSRGVCEVDRAGELIGITERTRIVRRGSGAAYSPDDGISWVPVDPESTVSMNLWGFTPDFTERIRDGFPAFLARGLKENPLKCEYFLPSVVQDLIRSGRARVNVLTSGDKWYGVTYREDKPKVGAAIKDMKEKGIYPEYLWR